MKMRVISKILVTVALLNTVVSAESKAPNIVFILADDLGWADTTPYGSTFHETPNIARLSKRGMQFTNFHTTSPVCSPARGSLMTGLYAETLGMTQPVGHIDTVSLKAYLPDRTWPHFKLMSPRSATRLDPKYPTYAKVLKAHGYRTGHYGKWHLGAAPYSPLDHGFDVDVPHTNAHGPKATYFGPKKYSETFTLKTGEHLEDRMAKEAVTYIQENKDRPFLLNYWAFSVHSPYFGKPELLEKYRRKAAALPSSAKQRNPVYAAMIETFDTNVGILLDAIDDAGITDNTIIILSSDNGGVTLPGYSGEKYWGNGTREEITQIPITSNHPMKGGKGDIYDGGTGVPFIVSWPGKVQADSTSHALFSGADVFPTLVEMAGATMPSDVSIDGVSQVTAMLGKEGPRDTLYGFWPNYSPRKVAIPAAWVREGDYKLTRFFHDAPDGTHRHTLHNVKEDPGETSDVASSYPEKAAEMSRMLDAHFTGVDAVLPVPNPNYNPDAVPPKR
jgi:arylsulfatase A-like enzyme